MRKQHENMHALVVQQLGARIGSGRLTGAIDLVAVANEFQVSRLLVREGLRTLAAKGLVQARPRLGTYVTPVERWSLLDEQVIQWRAAGPRRFAQMKDALELRQRLEPLGARLNARHPRPDVVEDLRAAVRGLELAIEEHDRPSMVVADTRFHVLLFTGGENEMLAQLGGTVHACLCVPDLQHLASFSTESVRRHLALVNLVAAGDERGAEEAAADLVAVAARLFISAARRIQETSRASLAS
ncbi:FadR/GntR family transcriptional regulator [Dactylosporangium sucinum]|uniref:HTH gntR-type domain-containing protein n=1 Tax=Dactylosporangium sucinum TaxID=1424081 RepID=A0A917U031_9ACTN|nr:FCD domain-containing protein [Dactylosporangium sucinum]GGM45761.1 hypothetical protein GCM10007977_054300 [Dactylosporangium sucinum]